MKKLFTQAIHFIGLSGIGWILDFTIYTVLGMVSANLVFNNTISSWVGVTFVFLFSTKQVFENHSKIPLKIKYVVYLLYQCVLIFFISKLLDKINIYLLTYAMISVVKDFSTIVSKIVVTPITMGLNFIIMKIIIEKI